MCIGCALVHFFPPKLHMYYPVGLHDVFNTSHLLSSASLDGLFGVTGLVLEIEQMNEITLFLLYFYEILVMADYYRHCCVKARIQVW